MQTICSIFLSPLFNMTYKHQRECRTVKHVSHSQWNAFIVYCLKWLVGQSCLKCCLYLSFLMACSTCYTVWGEFTLQTTETASHAYLTLSVTTELPRFAMDFSGTPPPTLFLLSVYIFNIMLSKNSTLYFILIIACSLDVICMFCKCILIYKRSSAEMRFNPPVKQKLMTGV